MESDDLADIFGMSGEGGSSDIATLLFRPQAESAGPAPPQCLQLSGTSQRLSEPLSNDLPCLQLCTMLDSLRIHADSNESKDVAPMHDSVVQPLLESFFPCSAVVVHSQAASSNNRQLSTAYLKLLTFIATNNLTGKEGLVSMPMMFKYLKPMMSNLLQSCRGSGLKIANVQRIPSLGPMAETLFRCAIEVGDDEAVRSLFLAGIDVNEQVCFAEGVRYTPIERSARLLHLRLTELLLSIGVDVHKTYEHKTYEKELHTDENRGALDYALLAYRENHGSACRDVPLPSQQEIGLQQIRVLIEAGGRAHRHCLNRAVKPEYQELWILLASTSTELWLNDWLRYGLFHRLFREMNEDFLSRLMEVVETHGINLNICLPFPEMDNDLQGQIWYVPEFPNRIIDVAALRGNLKLVQNLQRAGSRFTDDTLVAAMRSGDKDLMMYLIESPGIDGDCFSFYFRSTPLAEAIALEDFDMLRVLEDAGCMENITEDYRFCAALAAASHTGNVRLVRSFLALQCANKNVLGYALMRATLANQSEVAIILLSAGAYTSGSSCAAVFGFNHANFSRWCRLEASETVPLINVVRNKNPVLARALLDHDAPTDELCDSPYSPLTLALQWGHRETIKRLIFAGAAFCSPRRALSIAVGRNDFEITLLLLQNASWADHPWINKDENALLRAVEIQDPRMMKLLVDAGHDPANPDALLTAQENCPWAYDMLLNSLFKHRTANPWNVFVLFIAAVRTGNVNLVQTLLTGAIPIDSLVEEGSVGAVGTSSAESLRSSYRKVRERLLETRFSRSPMFSYITLPLRPSFSEWRCLPGAPYSMLTALLVAISTKRSALVELLLDYGADVNQPAQLGITRTPLQTAVELGSRPIVQLLLDRGADVNALPAVRRGGTALQLAAISGYVGIFELLLTHGADPKASPATVDGRVPIEGAAEHGRFDMLHYILKVSSPERHHLVSARELAANNGHHAIAAILDDTLRCHYSGAKGWQTTDVTAEECDDVLLESLKASLFADQNPTCVDPNAIEQETSNVDVASANLNRASLEKKSRYTCPQCGKRVSNASSLSRHERTHTHERRFPCNLCFKIFDRKDTLQRHRADKHDHNWTRIKCSSCPRTFRKDALKSHQRSCLQRAAKQKALVQGIN